MQRKRPKRQKSRFDKARHTNGNRPCYKGTSLALFCILFFAGILFGNVPVKKQGSVYMLEMNAFAKEEGLLVDYKAVERHFVITGKNFKCSFVVGLPYISLQGKVVPLGSNTFSDSEGVWIPIEAAQKELENALHKKFILNVSKNSLENASDSTNRKVFTDDRNAKAGLREVKTIIIDPGHGGKDTGAQGKKSNEKDIVLAIGKKLKVMLEENGFEVKMTRDKDVFIELGERPNLANTWNGDLFISLHCNAIEGDSIKHRKTKGYHFYVLRAPESEEDKAIARRENKVVALYGDKKAKTDISPIEWIKIQASLEVYQKNSFKFTEILLKTFEKGTIKRLGQGAGGAGFMVLVGALMPATLVELGFITNIDDEEFMNSDIGQNELARQIAKAVERYKENVHAYRETLSH